MLSPMAGSQVDLLTANNFDVYRGASWGPLLRKNGLVIMTDLDKTMTTGELFPSGNELADRKRVRQFIKEKGAVCAAVSARTLGLMLSSGALRKAQQKGYTEPEPRWGIGPDGNHTFVPLERDTFFDDCLDFDMLGSFGEGIMVSQPDGYAVDAYYNQLLRYGRSEWEMRSRERMLAADAEHRTLNSQLKTLLEIQEDFSMPWRVAMLAYLEEVLPDLRNFLHTIESLAKYHEGRTNVAPLKARIQLHFEGETGLRRMDELKARIDRDALAGHNLAGRIDYVDESKIYWNDAPKNKYTLYLVPKAARKENLIRRMLYGAAAAAGRPAKSLDLYYADDALTGFRAGLWGGGAARKAAYLLPTGAALAPYIIERRPAYGCESLEFLWQSKRRSWNRLRPVAGERGVYRFYVSTRIRNPSTVVIGDERYANMSPPESLAAFLEEYVNRAPN